MSFARAMAVRAVRTMAQTALGVMAGSYLITDVDFGLVVSASLFAGLFSVLTSVANGLPEVGDVPTDDHTV